MPSSARIEELKRKFDENPRRFFAHLANEYRKAGDLEQAIAICRAHVGQQPEYVSGQIVFGQALYESGALEEARPVFEGALKLDPENLIALRHLGDIARAQGDLDAARTWYQRVLDADPRNEEIAEQLRALDTEREAGAPMPAVSQPEWGEAAPAAPTAAGGATPAPHATAPVPLIDLNTSELAVPAKPTESPASATSAQAGSANDGFERSAPFDVSSMGGQAAAAAPAPAASSPAPAADLGLESMEFVPPSRDAMPSARAEGLETPETPFAASGSGTASVAQAASPGFVTETMAELYLQQGFRDEALSVYRQLLEQSPGDASLRERVDQLASGSRSSVGMAAMSDAFVEAAQQRQTAHQGRSVRSFFGSLAARRVPGRSERLAAAAAQMEQQPAHEEPGVSSDDEALRERPEASRELPFIYDTDAAPGPETELPKAVEPSALAYLADAEGGADRETIGFQPGVGHYDIGSEEEPTTEPGLPEELDPAALAYLAEQADAQAGSPGDGGYESGNDEQASASDGYAGVESAYGRGDASDDEGSLDSLFARGPAAESDERAASTLADAFDGPGDETTQAAAPPSTVSGAPTRAAATELSLDHVFREQSRKGEGRRDSASFSFDQFFAENNSNSSSEESESQATRSPQSDTESGGDIEQFNSWLEGLKKK